MGRGLPVFMKCSKLLISLRGNLEGRKLLGTYTLGL